MVTSDPSALIHVCSRSFFSIDDDNSFAAEAVIGFEGKASGSEDQSKCSSSCMVLMRSKARRDREDHVSQRESFACHLVIGKALCSALCAGRR